jgi:hypothetical protein
MSQKDCLAARNEPRHLLTCRACRTDARVAQAWKGLRRPEELEAPIEADSRFTDEVLASVRGDRVRRRRLRLALAAAAALLFFFFAGTGHETAGSGTATQDASYASLVSPNALDGLIPN